LRNLQAENSFKKLSSISLESQKLLNKNYCKYYIKPKRLYKITMAKSDIVGKKGKYLRKLRDYPLESRTWQRCSPLYCMINTMLRNPVVINEKSSLNPAVSVMPNVQKNISNAFALSHISVKKIKREKVKQVRKQLLGLKTIGNLLITIIIQPLSYIYLLTFKKYILFYMFIFTKYRTHARTCMYARAHTYTHVKYIYIIHLVYLYI